MRPGRGVALELREGRVVAKALADLASAPAPLLAAAALGAWMVLTPALVSGTLLAAATGLRLGATARPASAGTGGSSSA